jgi:hypothetical protein
MSTMQDREQDQVVEKHKRDSLNARIGEQLLQTLGRPGDLFKVQVRWVWENSYRVNILVGVDASAVKVAHSFFLKADDDGNILQTTPKIAKQY